MRETRNAELRYWGSLPSLSLGGRCLGLAVILFSSALGRAQIALDGSMGPAAGPIAGPNHVISSELGQIKGNNLFYSFNQFNIHAGESATFTGPSATANIISRVTGGLPSSIDGTIDSRTSMPSANLFLLNPSGVMIGPNARLNVGGSFHVSTADYVRFADGAQYFANLSSHSTLTVAEPVAFGFLSPPSAGSISVDGSDLSVSRGKTLSLVGRDVQIVGATLAAPEGRIHLNSQGTGEVSLQSPATPSNVVSGTIDIIGSTSDVSGGPAGTVVVRGGRLLIDTSSVTANTSGSAGGAPAEIGSAGPMQILAPALNITGNASIQSLNSGGQAGDIVVHVGRLSMAGAAQIQLEGGKLEVIATESVAISDRAGISSQTLGRNAGSITLVTPLLSIDNGFISTATTGTGNASSVSLEVGTLSLINGGQIVSNSIYDTSVAEGSTNIAPGAGGNIRVAATGMVTISGSAPNGESPVMEPFKTFIADGSSGIFSTTFSENGNPGSGAGGTICISVPHLALGDGGKLSSVTYGPGNAGRINVTADQIGIAMTGSVSTSTLGAGHGGNVSLKAYQIRVVNATLSTVVSGDGAGGDMLLEAVNVVMENSQITTYHSAPGTDTNVGGAVIVEGSSPGSSLTMKGASIQSLTDVSGRGGNISVEVGNLAISGGSSLATSTNGSGPAGNLTVNVTGQVLIADPNSALSTTSGGSGLVGDLVVHSGTLVLERQAQLNAGSFAGTRGGNLEVEGRESITISSGAGISGQAFDQAVGSIKITTPSLIVDNAFISTATAGIGDAGAMALDVGSLTLINGGQIASSNAVRALGAGGNIDITAQGAVSISGRSPTGQSPITQPFKLLDEASSGIFSTASSLNANAASGGKITITAPTLALSNGGKLSVATIGPGAAGSIALDVGSLTVESGASITSSTSNSGNAGGIAVLANTATLASGGRIDSGTTNAGRGGTITLAATDSLSLAAGAGLFSNAGGIGPGGDVIVAARHIELTGGSTISASSTGSAEALAGNVNIVFGDTLRMDGSSIATRSQLADGGNITITSTGSMLTLNNSQITTSVQSGSGSGGNITLGSQLHPLGFAILSNSGIQANAFGGNGGNIDIISDVYLLSGSLVSASSALSAPGTIDVEARFTNVSDSLVQLPDNLLQAANLLRSACAARVAEGKASSLVVAGREGVPPEPEGLLRSPLIATPVGIATGLSEDRETELLPQFAGLWFGSYCAR
jgi:filamentous hemagglutinin family protein